jgi:hypothetical protein
VQVAVVDATGRPQKAGEVAAALGEQGFVATSLGELAWRSSTVVLFPPGQGAQARTVAAALGDVPVRASTAVPGVTAQLGRDYSLDDLRTVRGERRGQGWRPTADGGRPTGGTTSAATATCAQ